MRSSATPRCRVVSGDFATRAGRSGHVYVRSLCRLLSLSVDVSPHGCSGGLALHPCSHTAAKAQTSLSRTDVPPGIRPQRKPRRRVNPLQREALSPRRARTSLVRLLVQPVVFFESCTRSCFPSPPVSMGGRAFLDPTRHQE